ncbi:MAG TPA: hypothetical protein PKY19_03955 [Oscillospiraceae bacterium]|nr:hypothetical protein [Oscillospiraceae bacterium]
MNRDTISMECLKHSLVLLLRDNPIEKIHITDLCRRAGICRATFYLYFDDIYFLQEAVMNDLLDPLKNLQANSCKDSKQTIQAFKTLFDIIDSKKEWYHTFLADKNNLYFYLRFRDILIGIIHSYLPQGNCEKYYDNAVAGAVLELINDGLKNGRTFSLEDAFLSIIQLLNLESHENDTAFEEALFRA